MKFYQIIVFTLSTVSLIHNSFQTESNEENSNYHIEFEDKNPKGGYGYKIQVSNKGKFQKHWKNPAKETPVDTASTNLDYSQNHQISDTFQDEKPAQNSYLNSASIITNSELSHGPQQFTDSNIQSQYSNNEPQLEYSDSKFGIQTHYAYPNLESHTKYPESNFGAQFSNQNESPIPEESNSDDSTLIGFQNHQYDNNNPINTSPNVFSLQGEHENTAENSFTPQNYGQDWQTPQKFSSNYFTGKQPSLQIMSNEGRKQKTGPQVFVESTMGKINHQIANQFEPKPLVLPQSYYPQVSYHSSFKDLGYNFPTNAEFYKPVTQPKKTLKYKTNSHKNPSSYFRNSDVQPTIKYTNFQHNLPLASASNIHHVSDDEPHYREILQKTNSIRYGPRAPKSYSGQNFQKVKHSKGNVYHKSVSYAPKYTTQYIPKQESSAEEDLGSQYSDSSQILPVKHFVPQKYNGQSTFKTNNYEIPLYTKQTQKVPTDFKPSTQLNTNFDDIIKQFSQDGSQQNLFKPFVLDQSGQFSSNSPQMLNLANTYNSLMNGYNHQLGSLGNLGNVGTGIPVGSLYGNLGNSQQNMQLLSSGHVGNSQGLLNLNGLDLSGNGYSGGIQLMNLRRSHKEENKRFVDQKQTE